ncbi:hypothetical protein BSKO_06483 [Bryopsis sp. KO-2023]|nr:hypothetical protein BSKO_06483 [Bryopsis sp. KO-2023]
MAVLPLYGGGFRVAFSQLAIFYYGCGVVLHYVAPIIFRVRRIQSVERKLGEVTRDAFVSSGPIAVKAGVWVLVEWFHKSGFGKLYEGRPSSILDVLYLCLTIALLDILHDAWFYWTHRLMHWGPLYKHIHHIHHRTRAPTAFTGYSFHVIEALIVFSNEVLVCFLFPIHMGLHRIYHIATTIIHEGGHAGYEIAPFVPTLFNMLFLVFRGGQKIPPKALNTVQHHDMHHCFPKNHFSLYFTHWDRWLGTLHPTYDAKVVDFFSVKN